MKLLTETVRRPYVLPVVMVLLFALPAETQAQRAETYLSADSVTIGERFFLSLVVEHDVTQQPVFPDEAIPDSLRAAGNLVLGDLEVITRKALTTRTDVNTGARIDSVVYEVATFVLDSAYVPALPVFFTADADTFSVHAAELSIPVISLVPDDAEGIRDLAPLAEFPRSLWPWVIGALLAIALIGMLYAYQRYRANQPLVITPAEPPPIPPFEEALERLRKLQTVDLSEQNSVKPFYIELSEALRVYLSRRLEIPAMENTTRELLHELDRCRTSKPLPPTLSENVSTVLNLADLAKFADARPPAEESLNALDKTFSTLHKVENALLPVEEPEPVPDETVPTP